MKIKIITSLKLLLCLIGFTAYSQPKNPFAYYTFDAAVANPIIAPATLPLPYISSTGCSFCGIKLIPTNTNQVSSHNTGQINTEFYQSNAANSQTSTLDGWGITRMDASSSDAITVEMLVRFDKSAVFQRKASLFNLTEVNGDVIIATFSFDATGNEVPFISFSTSARNNNGNLIADNFKMTLDGTGRKSLSHYLDQKWHHLVFIYNAGLGKKELYVDGQLPVTSPDVIVTIQDDLGVGFNKSVSPGQLGNYTYSLTPTSTVYDQLEGGIDEVAFYNDELDPLEIYKHFTDAIDNDGNVKGHYTLGFLYPPSFQNDIPSYLNYLNPDDMPDGYSSGESPYDPSVCANSEKPRNVFYSAINIQQDAISQLSSYPTARYLQGNVLKPNTAWFGLNYLSGYKNRRDDLSIISDADAVLTSIQIQNELASNWNYNFLLSENLSSDHNWTGNPTTNFESAWLNEAKLHLSDYTFGINTYRIQLNLGASFPNAINPKNYVANRNLTPPENWYLMDWSTGTPTQFLGTNLNPCFTSDCPTWLPSQPFTNYNLDGDEVNSYLTNLFDVSGGDFTGTLNYIGENNEYSHPHRYVAPLPSDVDGDGIPDLWESVQPVVSEFTLGSINPDLTFDFQIPQWANNSIAGFSNYLSCKKLELDNYSYRDRFMNIPQLSNTIFLNYAVDGVERTGRFVYDIYRYSQKPINNMYYSTTDLYPSTDGLWRGVIGARRGLQWLQEGREKEIALGDKLFAPFVSAGFGYKIDNNLRPAQYLGFLKLVGLHGVDFFHAGYFNIPDFNCSGTKSYDAANWYLPVNPKLTIWQLSTTSYAQAILSRSQQFFANGEIIKGDFPMKITTPSGARSYLFNTGNPEDAVVMRKLNLQENYLICGTIQGFSNLVGNADIYKTVEIELPVTAAKLKFNIRKQGSVYIFDNDASNPNAPVFYQLDKWHESKHPLKWTTDFYFEAEVYDNQPSNVAIKTEGLIISGADIDATNALSYVKYNVATPMDFLEYQFQPRDDGEANNYSLWVRARTASSSGSITFTLKNGTTTLATDILTNINSNSWSWIQIPIGIAYNNLSDNTIYSLQVLPSSGVIEIDEIKLSAPYSTSCSSDLVLPAGINTSSLGSSITGKTVEVSGLLIVDNTFEFSTCNIFPRPGAQIIIFEGGELKLTNSTIEGCQQMWRGIKVEVDGKITLNGSTIKDAIYGIDAMDRATIFSNNCLFENNIYGMHFQQPNYTDEDIGIINSDISNTIFRTAGSFKTTFVGQDIMPGNKCYAGISSGNMRFFVTGNLGPNTFDNLYCGIKSEGNGPLVANCKFSNIRGDVAFPTTATNSSGCGIFIRGGSLDHTGLGKTNSLNPTFSNCDKAIYGFVSSILTNDSYMENVDIGIQSSRISFYSPLSITNNEIHCNHIGILVDDLRSSEGIEIIDNILEVDLNNIGTANVGISIAGQFNDRDNRTAISGSNVINMRNNYTAGIHLNTIGYAQVNGCIINLFGNISGIETPAIRVDNCKALNVNCNSINDDPNTGIVTDKIGIETNTSTECIISCNASRNCGKAFSIHGVCTPMYFRGNNIGNNEIGLYVGGTGEMGQQDHQGNEWLGTYNNILGAARNDNAAVANSSFLFDITDNNSSLNIAFEPPSVVSAPLWFSSVPNATEYDCIDDVGCNPILLIICDNEEITELDRVVAQGFIEVSSSYPEETRWVAERHLYIRLLNCPELLQDDLMNSFFNAFSEFNSVRHFSEIENAGVNLFDIEVNGEEALHNCTENSNLLLYKLDSLYAALSVSTNEMERNSITELINVARFNLIQLNAQKEAIITALEQNQRVTAGLIAADNLIPLYSEQYEINEQQVNDIFLSGISTNSLTSSSQISTLQTIANQCPYSGGPAVYRARALLLSLGYQQAYNDKVVCAQNGIAWRNSKKEIIANILPNPVNQIAELNIQLNAKETGIVNIYDFTGRKVLYFDLSSNDVKYFIPVTHLNPGIYSVLIQLSDNNTKQLKLSVIH